MKLVVYFYGYGSSAGTSDKVARLRAGLVSSQVIAFEASIDPDLAIQDVADQITIELVDGRHSNATVIFVGTSLGGWLAATLAEKFGVKAILINPACDPKLTLGKLGIPDEILAKYNRMPVLKSAKYFLATRDEVLPPFAQFIDPTELDIDWFENATHRFNGPEFERVIDYINGLKAT